MTLALSPRLLSLSVGFINFSTAVFNSSFVEFNTSNYARIKLYNLNKGNITYEDKKNAKFEGGTLAEHNDGNLWPGYYFSNNDFTFNAKYINWGIYLYLEDIPKGTIITNGKISSLIDYEEIVSKKGTKIILHKAEQNYYNLIEIWHPKNTNSAIVKLIPNICD